jgi:hypothetical protein
MAGDKSITQNSVGTPEHDRVVIIWQPYLLTKTKHYCIVYKHCRNFSIWRAIYMYIKDSMIMIDKLFTLKQIEYIEN